MKLTLRFKLFAFAFLFYCSLVQAQWQNGLWIEKQAYNWYFGIDIGLNFETNPPTSLAQCDASMVNEGKGVMSDAEGNLLFYSDGVTVYNKNHEVMFNGAGLVGDPSATHTGLIIPKPGNPGLYFVFSNSGEGGIMSTMLSYSEVDMALDNGLGGVTENKNIELAVPSGEKLSAIYHEDGERIWVVCHTGSADVPSNIFKAFLVTEEGISDTPVISTIGQVLGQSYGQMKISPDGSKIAMINGIISTSLQVFDFDNATGVISNVIDLSSALSSILVYGIEFSPNSRYLYSGDGLPTPLAKVQQFDLDAGDEAAVLSSGITLYESDIPTMFAFQLGPDGRIYIINFDNSLDANVNVQTLSVIQNPNNAGIAAGFQYQAVDVNEDVPYSMALGLPNFIQSYFESGILYDGLCFVEEVTFSTLRIPDITAISWDFGDTASGTDNTSSMINPSHTFSAPGTYIVTAVITSNGAEQVAITQVVVAPLPDAVIPVEGREQCSDTDTAIFNLLSFNDQILNGQDASAFTVNYYASEEDILTNNAIIDPSAFSAGSQTLYVKVSNNETDCFTVISFELIVNPIPLATVPGDMELCGGTTSTAIFNLQQQDTAILGNQDPDVFTITYFAEQEDIVSGNPITDPQNFVSSGQIIYAMVTNSVTGCASLPVEFDLVVTGPVLMTETLILTDCSPFDLALVSAQLPEGLLLSYYTNEEDAVNAVNAIVDFDRYIVEDTGQTLYVRAEDEDRCTEIYLVNLEFAMCEIPRGISPNGDTMNDSFDLSNFDVARLEIFNRYGQQVYSRNNYSSEWYGQADNGDELPTGTYYYMVEFEDGTSRTGWVYINREE